MPMRRVRTLAGLLALTIVAATLSAALPTPVSAQEPVPPDDGAPPEEYIPSIEGRSVFSLLAEGEGESLPTSPPVDNAFPISGRLRSSCTNSFHQPRGDRLHLGVDCFAPLGTPLVAVEAGTIRYATAGDPFSCATGGDISGNRVSVRGRSGYVYYYGHLDQILVQTDQWVEEGQVIGTIGRTGNAACSSAHLHFEVKCGENGEPFDPYPPMATWGSPSPGIPVAATTALLGAGVGVSGPSRRDLFVLECGEVIRQKTWTGPSGLSTAWARVIGVASSDPDAATPAPGWNPQVFVRGTDGAIWQLIQNAGSWWGFSLGGGCVSGPSAVYTTASRLDVFCRGADGAIYQRIWHESVGWTGWFRLGGLATSDPDVTSPSPQQMPQVFVRGPDNAIYQLIWSGTTWFSVNLGGNCASGPSAAYSGPNRVDVFCRGGDLALYHRYWRPDIGWAQWYRIGGQLLSDPEAAPGAFGGVADVMVRGLDRRLYQFYWDGAAWAATVWGVT